MSHVEPYPVAKTEPHHIYEQKPAERMPEGFEEVPGSHVCINPKTGQIVVFGIPDNSEEALEACERGVLGHNCDEMGCGSVTPHVLAVGRVEYPLVLAGELDLSQVLMEVCGEGSSVETKTEGESQAKG